MKTREFISHYKDGERLCPVCGNTPLPAHVIWPGARYLVCGKADCVRKVKSLRWGRYIGPNDTKCQGRDCNNSIPEGRYGGRVVYFACCADCWKNRSAEGNILMKCGCGCGQEFLRPSRRATVSGLRFLSMKHRDDYIRMKHLNEASGAFRATIDEYFAGFVALHYRGIRTIRTRLLLFFLYLNEQGITSLEEITPKTVTHYLVWAERSNRRNGSRSMSSVSTFFKWAIVEGHRKAANPVIGLIHNQRKKKSMPRPLKESELAFTWKLLHERGTARLRFAAAAAEEAGLRIGEICRLRIKDVDIERQRFFVRLPNKTNTERWAFFSSKTRQFYNEWMNERNPNCGHDCVLHNTKGDPSQPASLRDEFKRTLCKTYDGKQVNETGIEKWSTHSLRHTMASNLVSAGADAATVMAAGGWLSFDAMAGYAKVDSAVARRGYDEAMDRVQKQKQPELRKIVISPAELLKRRQVSAPKEQSLEASERCV